MPVIMLMLITLLNDGTLISIGYDTVKPSHYPEKWNLPALFFISCILGGVACGSSLLLLWAGLDSWNPDGIFAKFGIPGLDYGKIITMIYLKVRACAAGRQRTSSSTTDSGPWQEEREHVRAHGSVACSAPCCDRRRGVVGRRSQTAPLATFPLVCARARRCRSATS